MKNLKRTIITLTLLPIIGVFIADIYDIFSDNSITNTVYWISLLISVLAIFLCIRTIVKLKQSIILMVVLTLVNLFLFGMCFALIFVNP